jgi:hypothetical protein
VDLRDRFQEKKGAYLCSAVFAHEKKVELERFLGSIVDRLKDLAEDSRISVEEVDGRIFFYIDGKEVAHALRIDSGTWLFFLNDENFLRLRYFLDSVLEVL